MVDDFGAAVNVLNEQGTSPLFHSVSAGRRTVADFLVDRGITLSWRFLCSRITLGADVDLTKDEGGWRPIHAACYNEFEKLTNFLIEHGAGLSYPCKDIKGYTPLHILIATDDPPMKLIELLVRKGARINATAENGGTPLHLAAFWGHFDVVKVLVEEGASMDVKNDKGRTPLDLSALYGYRKMAEYLADKSGKPMPDLKNKEKVLHDMQAPNEPPKPPGDKKP